MHSVFWMHIFALYIQAEFHHEFSVSSVLTPTSRKLTALATNQLAVFFFFFANTIPSFCYLANHWTVLKTLHRVPHIFDIKPQESRHNTHSTNIGACFTIHPIASMPPRHSKWLTPLASQTKSIMFPWFPALFCSIFAQLHTRTNRLDQTALVLIISTSCAESLINT